MMKNEIQMQLYQAIENDNVREVKKLTKDIPLVELAAFIDDKKLYSLWSKIKNEAMFKELLRWKPQPTVLTLENTQNILYNREISPKRKFLLLKNIDSFQNESRIYMNIIYGMIITNEYHQDPCFLPLLKLILERNKVSLKTHYIHAPYKNGTYLRRPTPLQLAYFYNCVPAVETLLQHFSLKEMTEQLNTEVQVYTLTAPPITKKPFPYFKSRRSTTDTYCTYDVDKQKHWHIEVYIDEKTDDEKMAYFDYQQQKSPLFAHTEKLFRHDGEDYYSYRYLKTPSECQTILNKLIINHFTEMGFSSELKHVLRPSKLLEVSSKAQACIAAYQIQMSDLAKRQEEIAALLKEQPLTSQILGKINQALSSIPVHLYHNDDWEAFLLVLDNALEDFSGKMKESDIDKGETFYFELCALIDRLKIIIQPSSKDMTVTENDMGVTEKNIFLKLNILKFHSLTQKLDHIPPEQKEENSDSIQREKIISAHAEALSVLKTINGLSADLAQLKELAEKREKAPKEVVEEKDKPVNSHPAAEYTEILNEGKTRLLTSNKEINYFDPTLASVIENMSNLWLFGNVDDDSFKEIQEKHQQYQKFQAYLKAQLFIRADIYLKSTFKSQYDEIYKTYTLYLSIAREKMSTFTEDSSQTIRRIFTQSVFNGDLKNKSEILFGILENVNRSIQQWIEAEKTVLESLNQEIADLKLNTDERLYCRKMFTSHIHHQKLKLLQTIFSCLKILLPRDFSELFKPLFKEDKAALQKILEQVKHSFNTLTINLCQSDYTLALLDEGKEEELELQMNIIYVRKEVDQRLSYTYRIDESDKNLVKTGFVDFEIKDELTDKSLASLNQKELIEDIIDTGSNSKQAKQLEQERKEILAILDLKPLPRSLSVQSSRRLPAPIEVSLPQPPTSSNKFSLLYQTARKIFTTSPTLPDPKISKEDNLKL